jgi:hypothetical protein
MFAGLGAFHNYQFENPASRSVAGPPAVWKQNVTGGAG